MGAGVARVTLGAGRVARWGRRNRNRQLLPTSNPGNSGDAAWGRRLLGVLRALALRRARAQVTGAGAGRGRRSRVPVAGAGRGVRPMAEAAVAAPPSTGRGRDGGGAGAGGQLSQAV